MRWGIHVADRSNPQNPIEYRSFRNKRAQAALTDAADFRDGALNLPRMGNLDREKDTRAAMMYGDGSVLLTSLNDPACEGTVLALYNEGLDAAIDRGRLDEEFVEFMYGVARGALDLQNMPQRRTARRSPDRVPHGEAPHTCQILHCGACLFDPLPHPIQLPIGV
jgi:hypothetical protein